MYPNDCGNFFDCSPLKDLSFEQAMKMLFKVDANGCPSLNITGNVDISGTPAVVVRTPNLIEDAVSIIPMPTPINVVSWSIIFDGVGGQLNGVVVPDKYQVNFGNGFDAITVAMNYIRPALGRVIISKLT
jgi:hypothetical protein